MANLWRLWRSVLLIGIGLYALYWMFDGRAAEIARLELPAKGIKAQGRITHVRKNIERPSENWVIAYTYSDWKGMKYDIYNRDISETNGIWTDGPIEVWYDPVSPSTCISNPEVHYKKYGALGFKGVVTVMVVFVAIGCLFFFLSLRKLSTHIPPPDATSHIG